MGCKNYVNHASFVAIHGNPVLDLLDPKEGEKILDLGRGDGASTFRIAKAGVIVHGVDSSSNMIRSAIDRGFCAEVGSGDFLAFTNEFDAVFLNAALHWMTDYESTIAGVYSALKSKGRLRSLETLITLGFSLRLNFIKRNWRRVGSTLITLN